MSFIRPEAQETLWRWREVLVGAALGLLGLWMGWSGIGAQAIVGIVLMVAGVALCAAGWQRGRFRAGRDGAGVVHVTEGQVTYYGPLTGGVLARSEISRVALDGRGTPHWVLSAPGRDDLAIPTNAEGAEALFDVFSALDGFPTEAMLAALEGPGQEVSVIWQHRTAALH
ncbi:MAG: hypothetical protein AAGF74_15135 [Pseudomonadota bacterium]